MKNIQKIITALITVVFAIVLPIGINANDSFIAGEGLEPLEKVQKDFIYENREIQGQTIAVPISKDKCILYRVRVNLAIERKINEFVEELKQRNAERETSGWMQWQIGQRKAENENTGDSLVLIKTYYVKGGVHPVSFIQGMTFDKKGNEIPFKEQKSIEKLLKTDIDKWVKTTAKKEGHQLFEDTNVEELPQNYYIGRNGKTYVLFQEYDIAPYSEGWIALPVEN